MIAMSPPMAFAGPSGSSRPRTREGLDPLHGLDLDLLVDGDALALRHFLRQQDGVGFCKEQQGIRDVGTLIGQL